MACRNAGWVIGVAEREGDVKSLTIEPEKVGAKLISHGREGMADYIQEPLVLHSRR